MPDPTYNPVHQTICKACDDVVSVETIDLNGYCTDCSDDLIEHLDRLQPLIDPDDENIAYFDNAWNLMS